MSVALIQNQIEKLSRQWLLVSLAEAEGAWAGDLGQQTRACLKVSQRELYYPPGLRWPLEKAIGQLHTQPRHWPAWVVLWLYRRQFAGLPELMPPPWLVVAQELALTSGLAMLDILPSPDSFQITLMVPTYNRLPTLKRTLASILQQSDPNWSLIVCNDASNDGTDEYCRALAEREPRLRYLRNEVNLGHSKTFERLCEAAETELVADCSDDDWFYPDYLKYNRQILQRFPWIAAVSQGFHILSPDRQVLRKHGPYYHRDQIVDNQLELQRAALLCPVGPGVIHRKTLLRQMAPWDHSYRGGVGSYAIWDYLKTVKILGRYEMAYGHTLQSAMEATADSVYVSRDNSPFLLDLFRHLLNDYEALFGTHSYPRCLADIFVQYVALNLKRIYPQNPSKINEFNLQAQHLLERCHSLTIPRVSVKRPYSCRNFMAEALEARLLKWGWLALPPEPILVGERVPVDSSP